MKSTMRSARRVTLITLYVMGKRKHTSMLERWLAIPASLAIGNACQFLTWSAALQIVLARWTGMQQAVCPLANIGHPQKVGAPAGVRTCSLGAP